MELQKFHELAQLTGFDTLPDLQVIFPDLVDTQSIAELGAGYGRCVLGLLEMGYAGEIFAVDRIPHLLQLIEEQTTHPPVSPIQQDIRDLQLLTAVDAVLWLWSGILEQTPEDQMLCLHRIYSQLHPQGKAYIDAPRDQIKYVGKKIDRKYIRVETEWGTLEGYMPYPEDMARMSEAAGFSSLEQRPYSSATGLEREMYILTK